jgi:PleD family two-component response regulator
MTSPAIATHEQLGLVALSAGIATWDGTQTAAQLIAAADAFLYAAKAAGRNRTATTLADVPASRLQYS